MISALKSQTDAVKTDDLTVTVSTFTSGRFVLAFYGRCAATMASCHMDKEDAKRLAETILAEISFLDANKTTDIMGSAGVPTTEAAQGE